MNRAAAALARHPFAAVALLCLGSGQAWGQQQPGPAGFAARFKPPSFTAEQVEQGRKLYELNCEMCHAPDFSGAPSGKPLKGRSFRTRWGGARTLGALFKYMRENMPPGRAGVLSGEEQTQLLALLLAENGLQPGAEPLPATYEALTAFRFFVPGGGGGGDTSGGLALEAKLPPWPARPNPAAELTNVTDEMLRNPPAGDWLLWRRTLDGFGFSPLRQITKRNVRNLRLVWSYNLPPGPIAGTPLVHDGVIFVHGSGDNVNAFDAATGELLWSWRREVPSGGGGGGGGGGVKRNMALYGDKLYFATGNSREVALDAKTGKLLWESPTINSVSGGPLVIKGKVIQGIGRGQGLGQLPVRAGAAPAGQGPPGPASSGPSAGTGVEAACVTCSGSGHVLAFDAANGKLLWNFNVIPEQPGEPGFNSWNDMPAGSRSGGAVWTTSYYDPDLNLVFTGTGNTYDTAPLQKPSSKPGVTNDALFTDSTLALNPDTGELVWYFQHMGNDQWDHDWAFEQQIIPLNINGKLIKTVVTMGKPAILDAVEASSGRYLFSLDAGLQNTVLRIDAKTGAKITDPKLTPGGTTKFVCPQVTGAKNWTPSSYNPETGMLYAPLTESCMTMEPVDPEDLSPFSSRVSYSTAPRPNSDGNYGRLQAFDLKNRKLAWAARQHAVPTSGILATAGGVVFGGSIDRRFAAYDDASGAILWQTRLGNVPTGAPISFSVDGKQYIAVVTGYGTLLSTGFLALIPDIQLPTAPSASIYVFALP